MRVVGAGSDTTEAAGGYGIKVAPATSYQVTFSGGGLPASVSAKISGVSKNVKVDLLGTAEILSSASTTLGAGAKDLGLLGLDAISGIGNGLVNTITGNKANNTLDGGAGNDTLMGGLGRDTLADDTGADNFRFNSRLEGGDRITDFVSGSDDLVFKMSAFGNISGVNLGNFAENTSGVAETALDRFVFETDTGILRHDLNGSNPGGAVVIATLLNVHDLAFGDFVLV